jgi:hypothetical protein
MRLRAAFLLGLKAVRQNLLPGLLLQAIMLCFILAYLFHGGTQSMLERVGDWREEAGYWFALITYVISGALLPELLRVFFFQKGRIDSANTWRFFTAAPIWGFMGMMVDFFYRCQNSWFGSGNEWQVIVAKVLVDQFIYSPFFANPLINAYLIIRNGGFSCQSVGSVFQRSFISETLLPVQLAGWSVWIPGVTLVYFIPPLLQLPVAVLIHAFWVLLLTTINERAPADGGN